MQLYKKTTKTEQRTPEKKQVEKKSPKFIYSLESYFSRLEENEERPPIPEHLIESSEMYCLSSGDKLSLD